MAETAFSEFKYRNKKLLILGYKLGKPSFATDIYKIQNNNIKQWFVFISWSWVWIFGMMRTNYFPSDWLNFAMEIC